MSEPEVPNALVGGRRRAREVALQVLYAVDLGLRDRAGVSEGDRAVGTEEPLEDEAERLSLRTSSSFERVVEHFDVPGNATAFARELVCAVATHARELDALIALHARNWRISRMAVVDRNVLRLAVYELLHTNTPVAVVIDEAVDLARRFGSDTSPAFVNGVLDAVARAVRAA
jgi:N utilization substance protein B